MNIRQLIALLLCLLSVISSQADIKARRPNIVLILADDLGYGDLSITGSKQITTPHIDSISENGVRFTQAYVTSAVCAPSRAGMLTGIHQASFGFCDNLTPVQRGHDPAFVGLPIQQKTLADHLKKVGYTTGIIGKWHLGELPQFHPQQRGFDHFWGYLGGGHDYFQSSEDGSGMKCRMQCSYKDAAPLSYLTDDQGSECVDFIRRHKSQPFFLFATFAAPHSPMQARDADLERFAHIRDKLRRTYCAMVHRLDENVGKILLELRAQGLEESTCVIFLSDNGGPCSPGISNGSVNAPFNGGKTTVLEGGIRTPLLLKYPGKIGKGLINDTMVSSLDIVPTCLELVGNSDVQKLKLHGISMLPVVENRANHAHHSHLYWNYTVGSAIREGEWKLLQLPDRLPQLYHLTVDAGEQVDRSAENPEKLAHLLKTLGDWEIKSPNPVFREPADWRLRHRSFYNAEYRLRQPE